MNFLLFFKKKSPELFGRFRSIQDQPNYDSHFFLKSEKIVLHNWKIETYFIAFLVVSHQYKTNKTMNFSLFLKNEKYFPRTEKCEQILLFFSCSHTNTRPTKLWSFHFFVNWENISENRKKFNMFYIHVQKAREKIEK